MHVCSLKGACPCHATAIFPHRLQLPAVTFSRSMKVKIPLECAVLLVLTYILYDGPKMLRFGALQERHLCPHVARDEAHPFPLRELPGLLYIKCLSEPDCTSLWCIDRRLQIVSILPTPELIRHTGVVCHSRLPLAHQCQKLLEVAFMSFACLLQHAWPRRRWLHALHSPP